MRTILVVGLVGILGCGGNSGGNGGRDGGVGGRDGGGGAPDACAGLACQIVDCGAKGMPSTSISGTVYAPNGSLPLYGVNVYVPRSDPGPITNGLTGACDVCGGALAGDPIVQTQTDEQGNFTLSGIPAGADIPVVIQIGKWRRQLKLHAVTACTGATLDPVETTLPKSRTDFTPDTTGVDMPQIAISTGNADALECLVRKLGIADKEITSDTDTPSGRVHLFADTMAGGGEGVDHFTTATSWKGGTGSFSDSQTLWGDPTKLAKYDVVFFSCEGGQHDETKSQQDLDHVKGYADAGGRVFLSHWHNIWIEGNTQAGRPATKVEPAWTPIATFSDTNTNLANGTVDTIDEMSNPKGASFAQWMVNVGASPARDQIPIEDRTGKHTALTVDKTLAEQWVYLDNGSDRNGNTIPGQVPQMFQFTTPQESDPSSRCGKVVFTDMHVSGDSTSPQAGSYPDSCATTGLTDQEKALAFMFFDISSCVPAIP